MLGKLFSIEGKVMVVTGGGRGIGAMIAESFVQCGAKVYITSRNADACQETATKLTDSGPGECIALPHDLSREKGVLAFAEQLKERESGVHALVNNSGGTWGEPFDSYPEAAFDKIFSLNVTSCFTMTRAVLPLLNAASGPSDPSRVINIASIAGSVPQPIPTFAYDASKAALIHMTKKLATELAPKVTVNSISPGFVPTKMSSQLLTYAPAEKIQSAIPAGRWGDELDMGGAAIFLASRAGQWVNGVDIPVDGGSIAKPVEMVED